MFQCAVAHVPPVVQANWHYGYWVPDMSVQCFTGWHRKLAIILGTPLMTLTW